jgi:hypothetical protein
MKYFNVMKDMFSAVHFCIISTEWSLNYHKLGKYVEYSLEHL